MQTFLPRNYIVLYFLFLCSPVKNTSQSVWIIVQCCPEYSFLQPENYMDLVQNWLTYTLQTNVWSIPPSLVSILSNMFRMETFFLESTIILSMSSFSSCNQFIRIFIFTESISLTLQTDGSSTKLSEVFSRNSQTVLVSFWQNDLFICRIF